MAIEQPTPSEADASVHDRLIRLLDDHQVRYTRMEHPPVYTSEEAARVRGTSLCSGAKALVCKLDDRFALFVLPAHCRLANRLVRRMLGSRHLRFASVEEVWQWTRLRPGAIPPFGSLFGLKTYCDELLTREPRINFNAGDHSVSLSIGVDDYLRVEQPVVGHFAVAPDEAAE
ncbi:MAG: deacylase [Pirellulaceae bacterium]|nr:MAG: deacylase [Pirellulaceae bacterium]